jgi:hypothetical protein
MAIVPVQIHICGTNGCSGKQLHHSKRGMVCEDGDLLSQTRVEAHRGGVDEDAVYAGMLIQQHRTCSAPANIFCQFSAPPESVLMLR